jgi:hypothetical protein
LARLVGGRGRERHDEEKKYYQEVEERDRQVEKERWGV